MGYLLVQNATVQCQHGGQAHPTATDPRVKIGGQAVVTQADAYTISTCPYTLPGGAPSPCVVATWITAARRVKANGTPVLLDDSTASCVPNGTGLTIIQTQARVKGQ